MPESFTDHLIVPVANEEDARATAIALQQYPHGRITVVHVVEKGDGAPDKLSVEQAQLLAEKSFTAFREILPNVDTEIAYDRDVVEAINDLAVDIGATSIAFLPRDSSRLVQLLTGDKALRLVTDTDLPVIALDRASEDH